MGASALQAILTNLMEYNAMQERNIVATSTLSKEQIEKETEMGDKISVCAQNALDASAKSKKIITTYIQLKAQ